MGNIFQEKKFIVVEDEFAQRKLLDLLLSRAGANVKTAADYEEGMSLLENHEPDLMLIDIMLPEVDGLTMCKRIREISSVPIIIVTARDRPDDVVAGLQAGADDYVVKPYESKVLVERIKAVLRRGTSDSQSKREGIFRDDYLCISLPDQVVIIEGKSIILNNHEYDLLSYLVRHANQTCTIAELMVHVWGTERSHHPEYIHVYVWRLRQKIEPNPRYPSYILADKDNGFRFVFPTT
jgi:two-component system response regulator RegX3